MILTIDDFKLYEAATKKKNLGYDLIIVDVQKAYNKYYTDEYLVELNKYADTFSRVFQIWDKEKSKNPDYIFKNQTGIYYKEYGPSLHIEDVPKYFLPQQHEYIINKLKNIPNDGDMFETMYNDYWIYLGQEKWFLCNKELTYFIKSLKKNNRKVIIVGKELNNSIYNMYYIMKQLGVEVEYELEYNYNENGSKFDKVEESKQIQESYRFQEETHNYQHRQYDISMYMFDDDVKVAYADYSLYDNKIHIKMIEALIKGKGYGKALMRELAKKYGYENIERQQLTPDGVKMRKSLDDEFNFNYKEYLDSQNKHISPDVIKDIRIKYPLIADFMSSMILFGYSETWNKYNDVLMKNKDQYKDFDFNDISDITEWIKNSVTNNHAPDKDVPDYINSYLDKLL